ncbi:MAG: hypothetical protein IKE43_09595 [Coriobacteriales bacterium]|nr:hypothetical protein [Coriobacteriales bacterium]
MKYEISSVKVYSQHIPLLKTMAILFGLACYWCLSMTFYDSGVTAILVESMVPATELYRVAAFNSSSNALFPVSILAMVLTTLIIIIADIKTGFLLVQKIRSIRLLAVVIGVVGAFGTLTVMLAPVFVLPVVVAYIGAIVMGCSAAGIMLGWGSAISKIPSKISYLIIPAAFFAGCFFQFCKTFLMPWGVVIFNTAMPLLSCLFWYMASKEFFSKANTGMRGLVYQDANISLLSQEPVPQTDGTAQVQSDNTPFPYLSMFKSLFADVPWRVAFLFFCCSLVGAFIERMGSIAYPIISGLEGTGIALIASAILMLAVVWGIVIKGKDFLPVWFVFVLILLATLVIVPAMGWISPQTQVLVIVAEKRCLIVLIWVFLVSTIFRGELPVITAFGAGHIALQSLPNFLGQAAGETVVGFAPQILDNLSTLCAVMAVVLVIALALTLFDSQSLLRGFRVPSSDPPGDEVPKETQQDKLAFLADKYGLSPRERDILELLIRGHTFPSISDELGISLNTIRTHSRNIYRKLNIHTKQELIDLIESI